MSGTQTSEGTVLFVDISDSSSLFRRLGDRDATRVVDRVLDVMAAEVEREGGSVVDRIGDEIMAEFPTAGSALRAAVAQQERTQLLRRELPEAGMLAVRTGLHHGPMERRDGRPVGTCVYRAKRIVDSAKAEQILTCEDSMRAAGNPGLPARQVERVLLRGQDTAVTLVEVLWNQPEATHIITPAPLEPASASLCISGAVGEHTLHRGAHEWIGRAPSCQLVVLFQGVSRQHAVLYERNGRFYLKDSSTNGTYVQRANTARVQHLYRDELALPREGWIGLGRAPDEGTGHTIHFRHLTHGH